MAGATSAVGRSGVGGVRGVSAAVALLVAMVLVCAGGPAGAWPVERDAVATSPGVGAAEAGAPAAGEAGRDGNEAPANSLRDQAAVFAGRVVDVVASAVAGAADGVKRETGWTDLHLYSVGAGIVAGVVIADILGSGGLGSMAVVGLGGMAGHWLAEDQERRALKAGEALTPLGQ